VKLWRSIGDFIDRLYGIIRSTVEIDQRNTHMSFNVRKGSLAAQVEATGQANQRLFNSGAVSECQSLQFVSNVAQID